MPRRLTFLTNHLIVPVTGTPAPTTRAARGHAFIFTDTREEQMQLLVGLLLEVSSISYLIKTVNNGNLATVLCRVALGLRTIKY